MRKAEHYDLAKTRSSQSLRKLVLIYQLIRIGKSDLIDIDCTNQLVEVDDTLLSFTYIS